MHCKLDSRGYYNTWWPLWTWKGHYTITIQSHGLLQDATCNFQLYFSLPCSVIIGLWRMCDLFARYVVYSSLSLQYNHHQLSQMDPRDALPAHRAVHRGIRTPRLRLSNTAVARQIHSNRPRCISVTVCWLRCAVQKCVLWTLGVTSVVI